MSQTLGPYRLLSELGAGGFGQVHLALDPEGHTVAVKLLHPQVAADASALARLAREVETMRLVRGPYIAEVLDVSLDGARPYLVTRYVQGKPLSAAPKPVPDLARLARGLAAALLAMHQAGVVHRDLKPANVMISDGDPVVIDFGIARAFDSLSATAPGAVIGTPGYLAPEVIEGRPAAAAADVFSFGATLAYAATGRQPFGDGPLSAVAYRVVHQEPDLDGVPGWLEPLVLECLRRDPATRPTAAELCLRLGVPLSAGSPAEATSGPHAAGFADDASGISATAVGPAVPYALHEGGPVQHEPTQASSRRRLGRSLGDARLRHREKVRRIWVIGSGLFISLMAAAAWTPLREVALFLFAGYSLAVLADAAVAVVSRAPLKRPRIAVDLAAVFGTAALGLIMSAIFEPWTLALFAITALVVGVVFLLSA
ncbi:serine/threonine-protein kinase [Nonomuraea soli]|uniref:Putative Ser/Thr protein kinase n=1 Tax=Nonomuraea soli TaxID=1032476 RepID=A0A7W0HSL4_9ACTN|nr:serine/threonine-protein kinase [Nonomuraea soli]MBA2894130.1 putative Ser/Thr protein kinase [Nonomuraea soli]